MMYNSIILNIGESRALSRDIDSMSFIEPDIQECITKAGKGDDHWLNNEWYRNARSYEDELFDENEFTEDKEFSFKNIKLYIANIKTLMSFKLRAVQGRIDDFNDPRDQDIIDISSMLKYLEFDEETFISESEKSGLSNMYPQAIEYIVDEYYR